MLFNVPQFIDIEDKIVGPFTAKQLGWMAIAGILLLIAWSSLDAAAFIIAAMIICALFGALAFYRPYNQPFQKFIMSGFSYFSKPKVYLWQRHYENIGKISKGPSQKKAAPVRKKSLTGEKIREISSMLDR